ncbi:MAG: hypothetical protein QXJ45_08170 [Thermoproteota archaeon]
MELYEYVQQIIKNFANNIQKGSYLFVISGEGEFQEVDDPLPKNPLKSSIKPKYALLLKVSTIDTDNRDTYEDKELLKKLKEKTEFFFLAEDRCCSWYTKGYRAEGFVYEVSSKKDGEKYVFSFKRKIARVEATLCKYSSTSLGKRSILEAIRLELKDLQLKIDYYSNGDAFLSLTVVVNVTITPEKQTESVKVPSPIILLPDEFEEVSTDDVRLKTVLEKI